MPSPAPLCASRALQFFAFFFVRARVIFGSVT
jgi:hypothetical protein